MSPLLSYRNYSHMLPCVLFIVLVFLFGMVQKRRSRRPKHLQLNVIFPASAPPTTLNPTPTPPHNVSIPIARLVAATSARPGQAGGHCHRNLRVLSTEEMAQKNDWCPPPQKNHQSLKDRSSSPPMYTLLSTLLSISLSLTS